MDVLAGRLSDTSRQVVLLAIAFLGPAPLTLLVVVSVLVTGFVIGGFLFGAIAVASVLAPILVWLCLRRGVHDPFDRASGDRGAAPAAPESVDSAGTGAAGSDVSPYGPRPGSGIAEAPGAAATGVPPNAGPDVERGSPTAKT